MEVTYSLPCGGSLVILADRTAGHGGIVWDASLVLAQAISRGIGGLLTPCATRQSSLGAPPELRVLELGAGCGLPGLVLAATQPCRVILTDRTSLVPLLEYNSGMNSPLIVTRGSSVCTAPLDFGQRLSRLPKHAQPPFDVVLASDVLGCADAGAFTALVKTLADVFAASAGCLVLMTYKPRASWEAEFFEAVRSRGWGLRLVASWSGAEVAALKRSCLQSPHRSSRPGSGAMADSSSNAQNSEQCALFPSDHDAAGSSGASASDPAAVLSEATAEIPGTESSSQHEASNFPDSSAIAAGYQGARRWSSGIVELWAVTPSTEGTRAC
jgi:hypothetical protein